MPGRSPSRALSSRAAAPSRGMAGNYVSSATEGVLLCAMCGLKPPDAKPGRCSSRQKMSVPHCIDACFGCLGALHK